MLTTYSDKVRARESQSLSTPMLSSIIGHITSHVSPSEAGCETITMIRHLTLFWLKHVLQAL